jgi:hypothetical protein
METNQITLTDEKTEQKSTQKPTDAGKKTTKQKSQLFTTESALAPPEQRGGDGCCPWCLSGTGIFEHHEDGRVGCGNCDAVIPIDADWYERGEKIVI